MNFVHRSLKPGKVFRANFLCHSCHMHTNILILKIITHNGFYFNLTINELKHEYDENVHCNYGGLAVFDRTDVISTVCMSSNGLYKYRNIYSKSHQIFVVIYSYTEYGSLKTPLSMSTTDCGHATINTHVCEYLFPCSFSFIRRIEYARFLEGTNQTCQRCTEDAYAFVTVKSGKCMIMQFT